MLSGHGLRGVGAEGRARSREAGLPRRRRGRAQEWGSGPLLLSDKSAGDCWGPAPGEGEGEGGAGLSVAWGLRTAEAAPDGSQVRESGPGRTP